MNITLAENVSANLRAIRDTSAELALTQSRLATGRAVNSALDNPGAFFTAQSMTNRASALSMLMDDVGKGLNSIKAADEGIKSISKLIDSAKASVARASASSSAVQNRSKLVSSAITTMAADDLTNAAGTANALDGKSLTVKNLESGESVNITFGADPGEVNTLDDLNGKLDEIGMQASLADGKLTLTTTSGNDGGTFSAVGSAAVTLFGASDATTEVKGSNVVYGGEGRTARLAAFNEFSKLLSQIDEVARDSGVNGLNLLAGDTLTVKFSEDGTSSFHVEGVAMDAEFLGLQGITEADFMSKSALDAVTKTLDAAASSLQSQASSFGTSLSIVQTRRNFTNAMVDILKEGAANLVNADLNEEAAYALALETRLTLSQTALSMSTRTEQSVLRMLG